MDFEKRLTNLENLLNSFIKAQSIADEYKEYDIEGCRNADSRQEESINALSGNVSGSYNPAKDYHQNEYCLFYGNLYRFIRTMGRGISPLNDTYWTLCDVATELNRIVNLIKEKEN